MNTSKTMAWAVDGISIIYLAIPLVLFLLGWVQRFIAVPLIVGLLGGCYFFLKSNVPTSNISLYGKSFLKKNLPIFIGVAAILFMAGLSGDWSQHSDWYVMQTQSI